MAVSLDIRDKVLVTLSFVDNELEATNGASSLSDKPAHTTLLRSASPIRHYSFNAATRNPRLPVVVSARSDWRDDVR